MNNGNKKGVSITQVGNVVDTINKKGKGALLVTRILVTDMSLVKDDDYRFEQQCLFDKFVEKEIIKEIGSVNEITDCNIEVLPMVELRGDSKTPKVSVTFRALVNQRKEVRKNGKQLSLSC